MRKRRFKEEQIVSILKEAESGVPVKDLCRKHGVSDATFYTWRKKYGGMEVGDAKKLRGLEEENRQLKKLLAETMLENAAIKDVLSKKW
ncbi:MAG: transposase [Bdellovibrionales bacterium]|nr:transposase [Bdellovibrionales bacterium]